MKILSEKEIIKLVSENINFREEVVVPIGEDASVFFPKQDSNMVATTDTMVLGTHFKSDIKPFDLGYIAAASNISDLSAMGAIPALALINLTIQEPSDKFISNFIKGYNALFKNFPVSVIGGDTTYGATSVTITLIGYTKSNNFMLTSNGKNDDKVFISGAVGESLLARKKDKYHLPDIRNQLGILLPDYANSCTDMSDGLLESLNNITKKSNLGAYINIEKIKVNNEVKEFINNRKISWEDILNYGEDYELLFTASSEKAAILKNICKNIGIDIYEIGALTRNKEINFFQDSQLLKIDNKNKFEHF